MPTETKTLLSKKSPTEGKRQLLPHDPAIHNAPPLWLRFCTLLVALLLDGRLARMIGPWSKDDDNLRILDPSDDGNTSFARNLQQSRAHLAAFS